MANKSTRRYRSFTTTQYSLNAGKFHTSLVPTRAVVETKNRTGTDNPLYKLHMSLGKSVTNPMNVLIRHYQVVNGASKMRFVKAVQLNQVSWLYNPGIGGVLDVAFTALPGIPALLADAKNLAAIGIRKKIQKETETWSGLQFLGELREAIHGVRHPAEALLSYTRAFSFTRNGIKKRHPKKEFRKALAATHLEFQFGVLPLLGDISSIASAALFRAEEGRVKRLSHRGTSDFSSFLPNEVFSAGGISTVTYNVEQRDSAGFQYIVGLRKQTNSSKGLSGIISQGGFVANNLVSTAWEITPLTVFIDYFINIGDVLSTGLISLTDVVWTCSTSKEQKVRTYFNPRVASNANIREEVPSPTKVTKSVLRYVRTADVVAIPQLRFELPVKPKRLKNLAAFLTLVLT